MNFRVKSIPVYVCLLGGLFLLGAGMYAASRRIGPSGDRPATRTATADLPVAPPAPRPSVVPPRVQAPLVPPPLVRNPRPAAPESGAKKPLSRDAQFRNASALIEKTYTASGVRLATSSAELSLALDEIRIGGRPLPETACARDVSPRPAVPNTDEEADAEAMVYPRGAVTEKYVSKGPGVEQIFVLDRSLESLKTGGDLTISVALKTALEAVRVSKDAGPGAAPIEQIEFRQPGGGTAFTCSDAVAVDAAGRKHPLTFAVGPGRLEMTLDAAFLSGAEFPLTIDPLIASGFFINGSTLVNQFPDMAFSPTAGSYLCVYEKEVTAANGDIECSTITPAGVVSGFLDVEVAVGNNSRRPRVARSGTNQFLLVWQENSGGKWSIQGQFINVAANVPSLSGAKFTIYADTQDNVSPAVGYCLTTNTYLVVWQRTFSATDNDIYARTVTTGGVLGGLAGVYTPGSYDESPTVTPVFTNPMGIAWISRPTGPTDLGDVFTASMDVSTLAVTAAFQNVDPADEGEPNLASEQGTPYAYLTWTRAFSSADLDTRACRVNFPPGVAPTLGALFYADFTGLTTFHPRAAIANRAGSKERVIFTFASNPSNPPTADSSDIRAAVYDSTTDPPTLLENLTITSQAHEDRNPCVAINKANLSCLVAWQNAYQGTTDLDIWGQSVDLVEAAVLPFPLSGLVTTEDAGTAVFNVSLKSAPSAAVTVSLASSNTAEGTVSPNALTFTPLNWNTSQPVTLTGVNDTVTDGNVAYFITMTVSSTDPDYSGIGVPSVSATNNDNEPEVRITVQSNAVEPVTNGAFTVTRTGSTVAALTVNYTVSGTAVAGVRYSALSGSVTIPIGQTTAAIPVNVIDDLIAEGNQTVVVSLTPAAPTYTVEVPSSAAVTIFDDDVAGFAVSAISGHTSENATPATFTVKLTSQPTASVTIPVASSNTAEGTVLPASLNFTTLNWNTAQTVTVTGVNDLITDGAVGYTINMTPTSSFDGNYNGKTVSPVAVVNDDNEPEVTIVATAPNAAEPATNGAFTVSRTGTTAVPVTINYTVGGTATAGVRYAALSGSVTIPAGQPSAVIPVNVIDDAIAEGIQSVIVTLTPNAPTYTVMSPSVATVNIADNDVAGFTISAISGHTSENGTPATFTVRLTSQPITSVNIPLASSNTNEGTVSPASLTFTTLNWNTAQTVTVTGVNDTVTDGAVAYQINLGPTTSIDINYQNKIPPSVAVINDDNEPEVTIVATTPNAAEPATNGAFTLTRTGTTAGSLTVNYTVGGTAVAGVRYGALPGSVTLLAGQSFVVIPVTVFDDLIAEGTQTVIVTLTPNAPTYTVMSPSVATVNIADNDSFGFVVSAISGHTSENGTPATFTIKLASQPTAGVTIPVASSNTAEGTVSPASLSFTTLNWNTAQTVTVTGVNDLVTDGAVAYQITMTPTVSADGNYNGKTVFPVAVINDDNEPEVTIVATLPNASEPATNGAFTVTRTGTTAGPLTVNYTVTGTAAAGVRYTALPGSVTILAGQSSAAIPVSVIDDLIAEGTQSVIVTLTPNAPLYTVMSPSTGTVNIADDDVAGGIVSPISGHTSENGTPATFTVVLTSQPTGTVTVPLASSNTNEGTVFPATLTFTTLNWNTAQTVTVTGVNDLVTDGAVAYQINLGPTASTDSNYNFKTPAPVAVVNDDNEPEVTIVATLPNASEPATNGAFTVTRTGTTAGTLTVNYTVTGTAAAGLRYTALSGSVTILAGQSSAVIPVNVIDDLIVQGTQTVIVTLTPNAPTYTVMSPSAATVNIADNDASGFVVSAISGHTSENLTTATFTVALASQPTAGVTIPVASSNTNEGTVSPASLSFTTLNWNTAQTVTVTGVNDLLTDGAVAYQINMTPTVSTDVNYSGKTVPAVAVINDDNEPEVTIVATTPNASEPATNGAFTVTRTGSTAGSLTVNYTVGGTATPGARYTALSGSVTILAGQTSAGIPVNIIDDLIAEGTQSVIVTLTPNAPTYTVMSPSTGTVTIADDDLAGAIVSAISGHTSENGTPATFTVQLTSQPTGSVSLPLASSNINEGTVSIPSLTFTPSNWNTAQTVTVTGVNDTVTDGAVAYQINLGPSTSTDPNYNNKTPPSVAVINDDNEPEVTIVATTPNASEPATNGAFTVTRTGTTAGTLTVNYTVTGTAAAGLRYTALSGSVTILAGQSSAVIPVNVIDDLIVQGTQTVIVTLTPNAPTYTVMSPSAATVNIADNDVAGFAVSLISGHTSENLTTATFTVQLTTVPSASVTIPVASSNTAEGTVSPASLTFTTANWNTAQTVTVTGVNDLLTDGAVAYQINMTPTASADGNYNAKTLSPVAVINDDNEPEVTIVATLPNASEPATNGAFTVTRTGSTIGALTVNYTVTGTAAAGVRYTALLGSVTIPIGQASAVIPVSVINDFIVEPSQSVIVTLTPNAPTYTVMSPSAGTVTIADDDVAGFNVSLISGHTSENLTTATFTVVLASQPTGSVTIPVASSNTNEGTVSPASLSFTTLNWNTAQTVTVTGVNDLLTDGAVAYQINMTPTVSTDGNYSAKTLPPVAVINDDNEPEVTVVATTPNASEPATNGAFTVTRTGTTAGALTVNYTVSGSATPGARYTALSGSVTILAGQSSAVIPVNVIDDLIVQGTQSVIVTLTPNAPTYTVMSPSAATVNIADNDVAGFNVSLISGHTSENLTTATFTVQLTTVPSASVTIPVASSNTAEGTVSPASLTFTTLNWNTAQTVTVTGVNDLLTDGAVAYQINMTPTASGDLNYNAKTVPAVAVINDDNEPEVTIVATTAAASEPATNGAFTVTRTGSTVAALTVNYTVTGTAAAGVRYTALTGSVTILAGNSSALIPVSVINDFIVEPSQSVIVTLTPNAPTYTVMSPSVATVTIADDDVAGFNVSLISGHTSENLTTATFTVVLASQPTAGVTIPVASSNTAEGTVLPASLTFTTTNWNVAQTVTVTGVNDLLTDGAVAYQINMTPTVSADGNYNAKTLSPVAVINDDNEPEVTIVATLPNASEPATNGAFTVTRTGSTIAALSVNYTVTGTAAAGVRYTALLGSVTIPIGQSSAVIPVSVINDFIVEPSQSVIVTLTPNAPTYTVMSPSAGTVTIADDDVAGFNVSLISGHTSENLTTATFTVVLASQPTGSVTIPVASSDISEGTVSPASLSFTTLNWNTAQTVTVTGVNDLLTDGAVAYQINMTPTVSTDGNYSGKTLPPVAVINDDNEPEVTVVATTPNASEPATNGAFTVTRTGTTAGALTVNYTVSGSATPGARYTALSGSVTILAGQSSAVIPVNVIDDLIVQGTQSVIVTLTPNAPTYTVMSPSAATVNIADNDVAGFNVSLISGHTSENLTTATFTVQLTTVPSASVTIPVASSNTAEGTVSPASLTFTTLNWNTAQTVTVTGVNDLLTDGAVAYQINMTPTASGDLNYTGKTVPAVAVINDDNEPEVTIVATTAAASEPSTNGAFTVTRTGSTAGALTVNYTVTGTAAAGVRYTALTGSVTIPIGQSSAVIPVAVINDFIVEPSQSVIVTLTPNAPTYTVMSPSVATVTIADDDVAGFNVSLISGNTSENGTSATFTVSLTSQPTANVTIPVASSNTAEGTVLPASLTFTTTNWNVAQTVTVTGVNDTVTDGAVAYQINMTPTVSTDGNYSAKTVPAVAVINDDNEPEVTIVATLPNASEPATDGAFTVTRTGDTSGALTVNYTVTGSAAAGVRYTALLGTVTIPIGQASAVIPVSVINDFIAEPTETVIVTLTPNAPTYTVMSPSTGTVSIADDDSPGFAVTPISGHTSENLTTATFTVRLTTAPTAGVTIPVASSNTNEGTVSPASLSFTAANWNTAQTVTVTGVNDLLTDGAVAYQINMTPTVSTDGNYNAKTVPAVAVINDDNEPEVTIVATTAAASEPSTNGAFTVTRTGSTVAALTVNYTVGGSATPGARYTALSGSVTIPIGQASAVIPVNVIDDLIVQGTQTVIVTLTPNAPTYTVMSPSAGTVTIADNDVAGFNVSLISGHTSENLTTATFTVQLTTVPSASVTIPVASSNTAEGTVSPASLTFTTANWNTAQTVTVTGVNDLLTDGAVAYQINMTPTASGDLNYTGKTVPAVAVINDDNEPEVTIVATTAAASEPSTNGAFTVTRTGSTAGALTVNYTVTGTAAAGVRYTALTGSVTIPIGQASAVIPVTVIDDLIVQGTQSVIVTLTPNAPTYTVMSPSAGTVTIADNDVAGFAVSLISGHTSENLTTATFTVALTSQPTADVTIPVASSNTAEGTVLPASLTFTTVNWNAAQTVTVTGVNDLLTDGAVAYQINLGLTVSADASYNNKTPAPVAVINDDNEPEVTIVATTPNASEPATNGAFTVTRTGSTVAALTVNYTVTGTAAAGVRYTALLGSVTIPIGQASALIPVNVIDDLIVQGTQSVIVTLTPNAPTYTVMSPSAGTVNIADNDVAGFNVSLISGHTSENLTTATFTVSLTSQPTASVTIPVASSNTAEGTVSPASLIFVPASWNVAQTVTVTGVNDLLTDGAVAYQINMTPTVSTDGNYSAKTLPPVAVINDDNEPEVTIVATLPNASEPATNGAFTVTRTGSTAGSLTVNYTVGGSATPGARYTALTGSVTILAGQTSAVIPVNIIDDLIVEPTETVIVTLTPNAPTYTVMSPSTGTVNIADNDAAGFTVSAISGHTSENLTTATFTVQLTTVPSASVTIPVASSNTAEGTVSPASLTFTTANWNTAQTVTVTGVNDLLTDGAVAYQINMTPTASGDLNYTGKTVPAVAVINDDNEPEVTIVATTAAASEPSTNGAFTVTRTGSTAGALTVNYTVTGTAAAGVRYTALTGSVTIPIGQASALIPVTVIDDLIVQGTQSVIVTLTPNAPTYTVMSPSAGTVTIADNDVAGFAVSLISGHTSENLTTATFTVALTSQPTADVTIPVASSNTAEGTVLPASLTFTTVNWNAAQTVTVTGVNDLLTDGAVAYQINLGLTVSADASYNNKTPAPVAVINDDNEPEVTIVATTPNASEPATNGAFTVTRTGSTVAALTVNYTVTGTAAAGVRYTALLGSVTIPIGQASALIPVNVIDDLIVQGTQSVIVTLTPNAPTYTVMSPSAGTVNIADNDVAGFNVSLISGHTSENLTTATFTVSLTSQPTASVTIPVASSNTAEGTVSPASLIFVPASWNVAQTVTVTGVNDLLTDGAVAYQINMTPTVSTDGNYSAKTLPPVAVINDDNEPEVTIVATLPNASEPATNGAFTVTRTGSTAGSLTVNYTVGGSATPGARYTALTGSVTILAGQTSAVIPVNIIDDLIVEPTETVIVTLTPNAPTYTVMSPSTGTVNIADNDAAGFTVSAISGHTSENLTTATFTVQLTTVPSASVTIPVASSNTAEGTVSPASLTFTTANWNTAQTVTVTGVNDLLTDGAVAYQINMTPTASGDLNYTGKTVPAVAVINDDNEPEVTIVATTAAASEPSTNGAFTVTRTGSTAGALTVNYTVTGTAAAGVRYTALTGSVTIPIGQASAVIPVAVINDFIVEPSQSVIVTLTPNAPTYTVMSPSAGTVTIADDDVAGFAVSLISGHTSENLTTATFTIKLSSQPTASVTIPVASSNTAEGTVLPASLTFTTTNWNVAQTVTVTGVNDLLTDGAVAYQINMTPTVSTDGNYSAKTVPAVAVINDDNEPEVTVVATLPNASEPATNGAFTVTRTGSTAGSLTVNYTVGGTATAGVRYTALSGSVTIPIGQASAVIPVSVINDLIVEPTETVIVTLTPNAPAYTVMSPSAGTVNIADDDSVGFVVSAISGHTSENLTTATFTVALASQPTAGVTIPVASSNTNEGTVSPASLTFTVANWNTAQTVTVTGVNDLLTDGAVAYQINMTPTVSTDGNYSAKTVPPVAVINDDNEPEVTIVATLPNASEPATNGAFTVTRTGDTSGALTVNYTVGGTATAGARYSALSGSVTIPAGQSSAVIAVTVIDDAIVEPTQSVIVTLTPKAPTYTVMSPSAATVNIADNDAAGFAVSAISGHTSENGTTATFTVTLTSQPTINVTIPVASSNTAEGTVSPASLTFTPANWNTAQTVTVTGVNDLVTDGAVAYQINMTPTASGDLNYNNKTLPPVAVINDDNEPEVTIVATLPNASEPATNGAFTVTRTGSTAGALTVNYTVGGTATAGVRYTALLGSVTIPAGQSSAVIPVNVIDDLVVEPTETVIVTLTPSAPTYTVMSPSAGTVNIADNDSAGFLVSGISGHTSENGTTATFTVSLVSQPAATVTIPVASSNTAEGTVSPGSLTFTTVNWNVAQTVTVTGVNDLVTDGAVAYQINMTPTASADGNYNAKTVPPVPVINDDNEPEVTVVATLPNASEPATNGAFTVTRTGDTSGSLTVNYTIGGTATPGVRYTSLSGSVTIPAGQSSAVIPVTVIDDIIVEPTETVIVTLTPAAPTYTVMSPSVATVNIADNDVATFSVSAISGHTSENGTTATFTVSLTSQPTASVTIPLASSNTAEGTVSPASLTFTPANWSTAQTVTVTGVNDLVTDGAVAYQINMTPTASADGSYNAKTVPPVAVINDDNEPEVTVVATLPNASEPATNGAFTVTRTGDTSGTLTVNYTIGGTATAGVRYTALSGSVTIPAGQSSAVIPVSVIDDLIVEPTETVIVTLTPNAPTYTVMSPSAATVNISDNDVAGFTVSAISGHTSENGATATFTVSLVSQPAANVTIPLASSNAAEGTVSPPSLTFTPANWNTAQTVTVTGVNDTVTDGAIAYQINLGPTASADGNYSGKTPPPVAVINDDNEPEVTIVATTPNASEPSTNGAFTVTRTGSTAASLTVNYTVGGTAIPGARYATLSGSVTIPAGQTSAPVAVTVLDNLVVDPIQSVVATLTPAAPTYTVMSPSVATVTIADDDVAGITVRAAVGLQTTELGGVATFTIALNTVPSANVTIPLTSSNPAEGSVPPSITFTPANALTPQTVTITGVADHVVDGDQAYTILTGVSVSADPNYNGIDPADVPVTNKDTDVLGFFINPVSGLLTTETGGTATFTVALTTIPTAAVTLPVTTSSASEGMVSSAGSPVPGTTLTLTFLPGNALVPQTVTITGQHDAVIGNVPYQIITGVAASADGSYNGINPPDVSVINLGNDVPDITVTPVSGLTTSEVGGTTFFVVVLNQAPVADVSISLSTSNASQGIISSASSPVPSAALTLTFTSVDWNTPQTVTVTGVNDHLVDGNQIYKIITAPAVSTDPRFNGINPPDVTLTSLSIDPPIPPQISLNVVVLSFSAVQGASNPIPQSLAISNIGQGILNWSAAVTQPWVSVSPPSGSIGIGNQFITISPDITGLVAGIYSDIMTVSDPAASNSPQSVSITLTILPPAPTAQITTPSVNPFTTASNLITFSGGSAGNATLVTWSNSATGQTGTATGPVTAWSADIALTAGDNEITIFAWNSGGAGIAQETVHYTPADSSPPLLAITDPSSAPVFDSPTSLVTIDGPVSDNVGVASVIWSNLTTGTTDAATVTVVGGVSQWSANVPLIQGANSVQVVAKDDAGNSTTVAVTIHYISPPDGVPPQVVILLPTSGDFWASAITPLPISGTAFDTVGVTKVSWRNFNTGGNGVAKGTANWSCSVPLTLGGNFISITAEDPSGNQSTSTLLVSFKPQTSDKVPPFLMVLTPSQNPVLNLSTPSVTLGGAAADDVALNTVVWSNPATGSSGTADGLASWTADIPLIVGANIVTLTAIDTSGNRTDRQLVITYKPPPPPPVHIKAGVCGLTGLECLILIGVAWMLRRGMGRGEKGVGR